MDEQFALFYRVRIKNCDEYDILDADRIDRINE